VNTDRAIPPNKDSTMTVQTETVQTELAALVKKADAMLTQYKNWHANTVGISGAVRGDGTGGAMGTLIDNVQVLRDHAQAAIVALE
jgi:hypothetical protein